MTGDARPESGDQQPADSIVVKCPECGHEFKTHEYGDLCGCDECGSAFNRFRNIVREL